MIKRLAATLALLLSLSACTTGTGAETPTPPEDESADAGEQTTGTESQSPDASEPATTSEQSTPSGATDQFPITVTHALGETTIEAEPTRIATLGWSDHDVVAALGVVPVGAVEITWGGNEAGSTDWFDAKVAELGGEAPTRYPDTDGAPINEIAALDPDLILATNSGLTEDEYQTLSQIAPVVAYPTGPWATTWEESLELVGEALGRSEQAAQLAVETQELIDSEAAKYPQIQGKSAAFVWFTPGDYSKVGVYANKDARAVFLEDLGFAVPQMVQQLNEEAPGQFSVEISAERAAELDAQVLMFYTADDMTEVDITSVPLFAAMQAFEQTSYVVVDDPVSATPLSSPSPLSIPVALETFLPKLAEAADRVQ